MSAPWWGREAGPDCVPRLFTGRETATAVTGALVPQIAPALADLLGELRQRIPEFTREWTNLGPHDAGVALVRLFGVELGPILERLEQLPEKMLADYLIHAGIEPLPASPARVLLQLETAAGATRAVLVARGFQVGAQPATGSGDLVIFETERNLYVMPGEIAELHAQERRSYRRVEVDSAEAFAPFGEQPQPGHALLIGLSGDADPGPLLSLGIGIATPSGEPTPVAVGGLGSLSTRPAPLLRWEVLDGSSYEPAEVLLDETAGLVCSGMVELRLPRRWRRGRPHGLDSEQDLRWLRVRLAHGSYQSAPKLALVRINTVRARAARTVRNELPAHLPGPLTRLRLSQTPVVPGSLHLEIEETTTGGELFAFDVATSGTSTDGTGGTSGTGDTWREVDDLAGYGPLDRVYTLDEVTGVITFGDGSHGARLPKGLRTVRAVSYQVGGGAAGAVAAEAVKTLVSSAPFISGVSNPLPAGGGTDTEPRRDTIRRGPRQIRARGRAVTEADYELLAVQAAGAHVRRAHAVSGCHPALPGAPIPGVVGLFVVPPDRGQGPPVPDQETLRAVAEYLSTECAPAGIEVVTAAPRYHQVQVELAVVIAGHADTGAVVRIVLDELDLYLDPLRGGDSGEGWPFGQPLRHAALLRRILFQVDEVRAVPRLNLVVDGQRLPACTDRVISPHGLLWPSGHQVIPLAAE